MLRPRPATDADREGEHRQILRNAPGFSRSEGCRRGKRPNGREEVSRGRGGFWLAKTFGIAAVACGASLEYEVVVGLNEIEASADLTDADAKWSQRPTR